MFNSSPLKNHADVGFVHKCSQVNGKLGEDNMNVLIFVEILKNNGLVMTNYSANMTKVLLQFKVVSLKTI